MAAYERSSAQARSRQANLTQYRLTDLGLPRKLRAYLLRSRSGVLTMSRHTSTTAHQLRLGTLEDAATIFRTVVALRPDRAHSHYDLGRSLSACARWNEANECYEHALALDPNHAPSATAIAEQLARMNRVGAAVAAYSRARKILPRNLKVALDGALMLPTAYASAVEMASCRARYASGLERLEAELPELLGGTRAELLTAAERVNFHLAYQCEDDLELQVRARLVFPCNRTGGSHQKHRGTRKFCT